MESAGKLEPYFKSIENRVGKAYALAEKARAQLKDPEQKVDIPIAEDLAARTEGLVSMIFPVLVGSGLKEDIRRLEKKHGKNDSRVALTAAERVAQEKYCKFGSKEKALDAGVRIGVAYLTLGVVTAPLEGISAVKITDNYVSVYYSGPIRSAGGTAAAMSVLIADSVRRKLGIGEYKPNELEAKRYATELADYSRLVGMQYHPSAEEVEMIVRNIKVCMTGDPTEKQEVSNYKDLPRVETNRIRGGMCLVVGEGLTLKAPKLLKRVHQFGKEFGLSDWKWLKEYNKLKNRLHSAPKSEKGENAKYTPSTKYVEKVIGGRPVIAHPARPGGFRLRYGRSRTAGLAAMSVHPSVMLLTEFMAVGTQFATELPGKATVLTPVDTVEPPVVLLDDGSVVRLDNSQDAVRLRKSMKKILSLGDILIPYGEFYSQGHRLLPSGFCEEWWALEVKRALERKKGVKVRQELLEKPFPAPSLEEALNISRTIKVPVHPRWNYFWHDLTADELGDLLSLVSEGKLVKKGLLVPRDERKIILEKLCLPHEAGEKRLALAEDGLALYECLGRPSKKDLPKLLDIAKKEGCVLSAVSKLAGFPVMARGTTRVGLKMGRPEKAERRLMKGRPQVLFPCGQEGGRMRNIMAAYEKGHVEADFPTLHCPACNLSSFFKVCASCGGRTSEKKYCQRCGRLVAGDEHCGAPAKGYKRMKADIRPALERAAANVGIKLEEVSLFKGVRGVMGSGKDVELLEKGLLRVKHDLFVNKDGTTRYDATDVPMSHFKPLEIGITVGQLKELGYERDYKGEELKSREQIVAIKPQDIILSDNEDFSGASYFVRVCQFVDEVLEKVYGLPAFYKVEKKEDLLGQLVMGLAPHTSAGIVGRIIGFTPAKVCYAHPFWHAAKRRNADGDEDSILLLMDAFLNFSRKYLPTTRGAATMDAPLVLTVRLDPEEVDDEAWSIDIDDSYPLEFYHDTMEYKQPWEITKKIGLVDDHIGKPSAYDSMFTHDTSNVNDAPFKTKYVMIETMLDKILMQLELARKIRSVDADDVAEKVLDKHFLKDIKGNLRTFSRQRFRCLDCNVKYRRIPLTGKCACGGKLLLTVHEGTVRKYIEPSKVIKEGFRLPAYLKQQFTILEKEADSLFGKKDRQLSLCAGFGSA